MAFVVYAVIGSGMMACEPLSFGAGVGAENGVCSTIATNSSRVWPAAIQLDTSPFTGRPGSVTIFTLRPAPWQLCAIASETLRRRLAVRRGSRACTLHRPGRRCHDMATRGTGTRLPNKPKTKTPDGDYPAESRRDSMS
jgi:hypothetical protein